MRLTIKELKERYRDKSFVEKFTNLFSLRILFLRALTNDDYTIPSAISDSIVLTDAGLDILERLGKLSSAPVHIQKFGLFVAFYSEELLVDVLQTQLEPFELLLDQQILSQQIKYPWAYGRLLYDKYFEEFDEQEDVLNHVDVQKLLNDTPEGVFHVGPYTIGPLGLLRSNHTRYLPPVREIRLWHCPDPSCTRFHKVVLRSGRNLISAVLHEIEKVIYPKIPSDWLLFFIRQIESENCYYDSDRIKEIPYLIINVLGTTEIRYLLKEIIDASSKFRSQLPNKKEFRGSSELIANQTKDRCFQLILQESDTNIINAIEKLIDQKKIFIPPTEVRRPLVTVARGYFGINHECNQLGVRAVSSKLNLGLRRLSSLLNRIYSDPTLQIQLEWKLRFIERGSLKEKIDSYILQEEPRRVIRDTVLCGPMQVASTFAFLFGNFETPASIEKEEKLIDKILWKLGFDINIYPNYLERFWGTLQNFKSAVISCTIFNDIEKEKIRSAAVNFWVSLEEILEQTLSFTSWLLLSDHYAQTAFKYNFEDARDCMCNWLNNYPIADGDRLTLDNRGRNTLFPLTEGFSALVNYCNKLLTEGSENFEREKLQMPSFADKTELISFPLLHKIFLFDIKSDIFKALEQVILEIPKSFSKSNVLSIRNRTQHKRDDFPTKEEILCACECVENVISIIEEKGIYPNVYLFKSSYTDKFNRSIHEFEDYKQRTISFQPTQEFTNSKIPIVKKPLIIVPAIPIANSNEYLRFIFEENSSYLKFWKKFPRRKAPKLQNDPVSDVQFQSEH